MNRIDHIGASRGFYEALIAGGHVLKGGEDDPDRVDQSAYSFAFCNGPECVLCGQSWCAHCESGRTPAPCPKAAIDAEFTDATGRRALPAP